MFQKLPAQLRLSGSKQQPQVHLVQAFGASWHLIQFSEHAAKYIIYMFDSDTYRDQLFMMRSLQHDDLCCNQVHCQQVSKCKYYSFNSGNSEMGNVICRGVRLFKHALIVGAIRYVHCRNLQVSFFSIRKLHTHFVYNTI